MGKLFDWIFGRPDEAEPVPMLARNLIRHGLKAMHTIAYFAEDGRLLAIGGPDEQKIVDTGTITRARIWLKNGSIVEATVGQDSSDINLSATTLGSWDLHYGKIGFWGSLFSVECQETVHDQA